MCQEHRNVNLVSGDSDGCGFRTDAFDSLNLLVGVRIDDGNGVRRRVGHIELFPIGRHRTAEGLSADLDGVNDFLGSCVNDGDCAAASVCHIDLPVVGRDSQGGRLFADQNLIDLGVNVIADFDDRDRIVVRVDDPNEAVVAGKANRTG